MRNFVPPPPLRKSWVRPCFGALLQGPIIQVWPSGQITLTGDVIGSGGGTMRYEATMVFRDPAMKLL